MPKLPFSLNDETADIMVIIRELVDHKSSGFIGLCERRKALAHALGISSGTLYRYEQLYRRDGLDLFFVKKPRKDLGHYRAFCLGAQLYVCRILYEREDEAIFSDSYLLRVLQDIALKSDKEACGVCIFNSNSPKYLGNNEAFSEIHGGFPTCRRPIQNGLVIPSHHSTIARFLRRPSPFFLAVYFRKWSGYGRRPIPRKHRR